MTYIYLFTALLSAFILTLIFSHLIKKQKWRSKLDLDLQQLGLLCSFLSHFQRHRGLSTAVLSGDSNMSTELSNTRNILKKLSDQADQLMPVMSEPWKQLSYDWKQILNTPSQSVEDNLQRHNRLIRETIYLIEDIANGMELYQKCEERQQFNYVWHEILQVAEWAGQARALGSGIAAEQSSTAAQRIRLRFLHQKISQQSNIAFSALHQTDRFELNAAQCQQQVTEFLWCLESELLSKKEPEIDSKAYFEQATLAINGLLSMVESTLRLLRRDHLDR